MRILSLVADFLDERTGYRALVRHALDEPIRGGARWAYVFGSALLAVFVMQLATGAALMTSYSPGDKTAWASVHFIQFVQPGGWLVRGLHHFGAQAMVTLLAAHLLQVATFGAYKRPREVTWWIGLVLFGLVLGFALTGYLLPWDQKGYWATRVATNIAGTIPMVGQTQQVLLQGGSDYGNLTLTRFYALHVFVLPGAVVLLVAIHVTLFRRHGVTPSSRADLTRVEAFYPAQLARDVAAAALVLGMVTALALRAHGAPLDAPADPSSDYPARPEWYFLGLFQLLKYFHGPLELVGTVVVPALVAGYLFALPLLDRGKGTALRARVRVLAPLGFVALAVATLTAQAVREDRRDPAFQKERTRADERAALANRLASGGVPPEGPLAMLRRSPEVRGPELFDKHCAGCHALGDHGTEKDRTAPRLDGWSTEAWIREMLHEPDGDARFGRTSFKGEMPSMDVKPADASEAWTPMSKEDVLAASTFLFAEGLEPGDDGPRDGAPRSTAGAAVLARGREIVTKRCTSCHTFGGEGDEGGTGIAPELRGYGSLMWTKAQIANPSSPSAYREQALDRDRKGHMPRFDAELTESDIELLARWVRARARGTPLRTPQVGLTLSEP